MSRTVYIVAPGFETALVDELGGGRAIETGVVECEITGPPRDPLFGRQVLPDAIRIAGTSVRALVEGAFDAMAPALDREASWALEAFAPDDPKDPWRPHALEPRAALVKEALLELMSKRRRRTSRRMVGSSERSELVVQLLLVTREHLEVSVTPPRVLASGARWPSPFAGGRAPIVEDRTAPSRAYKKLIEALAWMETDVHRGERCVDLGAAPGSWSHVALERGADVVAVDKADLDPRISASLRLEHVRGDAFAYAPEDPPVDWLWSDVIAEPEKSSQLLLRWAEARRFRRAIFHLKFKGTQSYRIAHDTLRGLHALGYDRFRAKHLVYDKNEITLFG